MLCSYQCKAPPHLEGWGFYQVGSQIPYPGDELLDQIPTYPPLLKEGIWHESCGLIVW